MDNLNEMQIKAINSTSDVTLVIAGAGSGKTTVIANRIYNLIDNHNIRPYSILAITFTNKASKEMKDRLQNKLNSDINLNVFTFHSFAVKVIRENVKLLNGFDNKFVIIDEEDKKRILKNIIKEHHYDVNINEVKYSISHAKSFASDIKTVEDNIFDFTYQDIFKIYQNYLKSNNAFDFDDLLLYCYKLLQIEEVSNKYKKYYKYIHVDEYQDTSIIQAKMLDLIKDKDTKLFLVGDVDQSIYEWRGATIDNIMNVQKKYKDINIIKLEQNYRSSNYILTAANSLIKNNINRYKKNLFTNKPNGQKIYSYRFKNDNEQAEFIESEVKYLKDFKTNLSEVAILYRLNYQSKKIEEALVRSNIPYIIYGGLKFYDRMEIKDTLAYLRLIINNDDNISFLRVCNTPKRKVGDKTLEDLINVANEQNISYFQAALRSSNNSLVNFCNLIVENRDITNNNFITNMHNFLVKLKYKEYLLNEEEKDKVEDRMLNIEQLLYSINDALNNNKELYEYLAELTLFTDSKNDNKSNCVILSTIHGVKGLEFDNVFLIGMNENIFPKSVDTSTSKEIEEERRVCYVAITRARKKLTLTNIAYNYNGLYLEDSRFISEMDIDVIDKSTNGNSSFKIF